MRGVPDGRHVQHGDEHRELREAEPRPDAEPARRAGGERRAEHERQRQSARACARSSLLPQVEERRVRADRRQRAVEVVRAAAARRRPLERVPAPGIVAGRRRASRDDDHDVPEEDERPRARSRTSRSSRQVPAGEARRRPGSRRRAAACRRSRGRTSGRTSGSCRRTSARSGACPSRSRSSAPGRPSGHQ